jgi:site-specific DNA recombinase
MSGTAGNDAVIYTRISRDRTGAGLGVRRQEDECRDLAARLGLAVRAVYSDNDISAAGKKRRPGYRQMLADLEAAPATVLCWHTDRLHRKLGELEEYADLSVRLGIATHAVKAGKLDLSTASGRLIAQVLGVIAGFEVAHMRERHQAAKRQQAARGEWRGGRRPFGYEPDGVRVRPAEAGAIAAGTRDVIAGCALGAVARQWNAAGLATSAGGRWDSREAGRVLRRARNAGLIEHDGDIIGPAAWPAIVTEPEWRQVRAVLEDPSRRTTPGPARRWLLSGIAVCGICGQPVKATTAGTRNPPGTRPVYRCREAGLHVGRDCRSLDAYIGGAVTGFLSRPDSIARLSQAMPAPGTAMLQNEIDGIRGQLDGLAFEARHRRITPRQMAQSSGPLMADLEKLEARLASVTRPTALSPFAGRDPADVWDAMLLDGKRAVVAELFSVTIYPAPKGRPRGWRPGEPYFHEESVQVKRREADG